MDKYIKGKDIFGNLRISLNCNSKLLIYGLILLLHIRFLIIVILEDRVLAVDLIFYLLIFSSLLLLHSRKILFILLPFIPISLFNSAAINLFLIFCTSFLVAKEISIKKFAEINVAIMIGVLCVMLVLIQIGILKESSMETSFFAEGEIQNIRTRYSWGFSNPNQLAMYIFGLLMNVYVLIKKRLYPVIIILFLIISICIYNLTLSRTFILTMFMFIIILGGCKYKVFRKFLIKTRFLLAYFPIFFVVCLLFLSKIGYSNIFIDILTSGRLKLYTSFINICTPSSYLLGTNLANEMTIDNSYLQLLYSAGIIGFCFSMYLWVSAVKKISYDNIIVYPIFLSFMMYGLMESVWTFLLCYGNMILWIIMIKLVLLNRNFSS